MDNEKIVPIISGGIDSTVMLWYFARNKYDIVETISFIYGQKHHVETDYAEKIMEMFREEFSLINHQLVDISNIGEIIAFGALTGKEDIPKTMYDDVSQRITVVPNRNMIFLSIAAARAITLGASLIGYAAHASDYSVYPDCRPEFIESMDKALILGNLWDPVHLEAPFKHLSKTEIVKLGIEIKAPLHLTWSCYEGSDRPCLECGTCLERTEAFLENEISDPALSETEWEAAKIKLLTIKNKLPIA